MQKALNEEKRLQLVVLVDDFPDLVGLLDNNYEFLQEVADTFDFKPAEVIFVDAYFCGEFFEIAQELVVVR